MKNRIQEIKEPNGTKERFCNAPAPDGLVLPLQIHAPQRGRRKPVLALLGGWGTMERKRTLRGSGREFDTIV